MNLPIPPHGIFYILDARTPVPVDNIHAWSEWWSTADRHVAEDTAGPYHISTVFLGLALSLRNNQPRLFETKISDTSKDHADIHTELAPTWSEAEDAHRRAVAHARTLLKDSTV